jgi:hypothetical protein
MSERIKPTYLRQHRVGDREQLLAEWQDLFPMFDPDSSRYGQTRRFRGRDLDPQEAGWVFQHWVCEAFRLCNLRVDDAYTVPLETSERIKEEIDGLVTMEWLGFLLQCKLERDPVPFDPIARLHLQVERRPVALSACSSLRSIRKLLSSSQRNCVRSG